MRPTAQPGDVVELKDKEGGFTDPDTGFDISRDQKLKLGDTVGTRTQEAVVSGGLLIVSGKKKASAGEPTKTGGDSDLPEDLPGREAFVQAGLSFEQVKALNEEQALAIKGIGKKTLEAMSAWAEANKK